jgi:hypothetical protein
MALTDKSTVCANSNNAQASVQGEAIILEMTAGKYFGLNRVGARVWQLIQSPVTLSELVGQISKEYDVESERLVADLTEFLCHLESARLITVR